MRATNAFEPHTGNERVRACRVDDDVLYPSLLDLGRA